MSAETHVTVAVPFMLRKDCRGKAQLPVLPGRVADILDQLHRDFPDLYRNCCQETGRVRPHINLFVNSTHLRDREGLETVLQPGDTLFILPAVSGG